ncbi:MAG: ABC transporter permease [Thermonemataceae bacterium]|nr:ABC transporter permease [Thermonemataceae bacterium]
MLQYLLKRIGYGFLILVGVVIVVFLLFHALPGDPVSMITGQRADEATRKAIKEDLGLDQPISIQLYRYLRDLSPVSIHKHSPKEQEKYDYVRLIPFGENALVLKMPYLRKSFQTQKKVSEIINERIWNTIILAITAMFFATVVGVFLGIITALNQGKWIDQTLIVISTIGISVPSFVAAAIISRYLGYVWSEFTGLNGIGTLWELDYEGEEKLMLRNLILPAFTLGIRPLSIIVQLTRSSMLEVLTQDYIRTARAKGVSKTLLIYKHALKNALTPVVTSVSGWLASLMGGTYFIEKIFNYQGLGYETISAVANLDMPIIMASALVVGVIFIVINIVVDISYALIDPRIRLK